MALGFFRRHQKMVIVVMVVLMVSFLIGGAATQWIMGPSGPGEYVLGRMTQPVELAVTSQDLQAAETDLRIFQAIRQTAAPAQAQWSNPDSQRGPGLYYRNYENAVLGVQVFNDRDEAVTAYMLLVKEAQGRGLDVVDMEVRQALTPLDLSGAGLSGVLSAVASHLGQGVSGDRIMEAVRRGLLIAKGMEMATPMHYGSVAEARELYMDIHERFQFEAVPVPAEAFLEEVKDRQPTREQLQEFFDARRDVEAGQYPNLDSMGFGYRKPDEIEIQYLLIDNRIIEMVSVPEEDSLSRWIADNADSLYKDVPVETGEDGDEGSEDGAAADDGEPETERKPLTEQEKRARAIEALRPGLVDQRVRVIEARLKEDLIDVDAPPLEKYRAVQESLTRPAGDLLDRKLNLAIYDVELKTALADITRQTGVQIAFPVGRFGDVNVDADVLVSAPSANGGTLGQVLAELGESITLDLGPEAWRRFELLPNAVFPKTEQLNMLPVRLGTTGLIPLKQLSQDRLLATAGSGQGSLADVLGQSEDLSKRVGVEGPVMDVRTNGEMSRMVWRVTRFVPAKAPQEITPELREQVVADWRTLQAYELALEKTRSEVTDAESMKAFAGEHDLEVERTGMLAKVPSTGPEYSAMMEFYREVAGLDDLSGMTGLGPQLDRMWKALRQLAPEDPAQGYSPVGDEAVVVPMPGTKRVLIARRVDYDPPVRSTFDSMVQGLVTQRYVGRRGFGGRPGVMGLRTQAQQSWLTLENVEQRVGYVRGDE